MADEIDRTRPLEQIGTELRHEVDQAEQGFQSAVGHAIRAGELLNEAKGRVKHGEWLPWLKANFPASERTARNYMRLAEKSATVADLPTIREAVAVLAQPKENPEAAIARHDAELEARANQPLRELMKLQWEQTIGMEDGYSFTEYGRIVGRSPASISQAAKGYALLQESEHAGCAHRSALDFALELEDPDENPGHDG